MAKQVKRKIQPYDKIKDILSTIPKHCQVEFALYCAEDSFIYVEEKDKAIVKACNETTRRWLNGKATHKECTDAAATATASSYASAYAAYSASYAAAYASSYAAYAASSASYSASYASTASAASTAYNKKMEEYLIVLKRIVSSLSEIEKLVFKIENLS